eukprot:1115479-Rhodomonas_salina.3
MSATTLRPRYALSGTDIGLLLRYPPAQYSYATRSAVLRAGMLVLLGAYVPTAYGAGRLE